MNARRRSVLVTVAAVMTLLLGLLFATGVVLAAHDLLAGPPATSFANEIMREDRERAQNFSFIGLILTLPATLLLVPGAVALFFRWRRARPLATIAVVYAVFAWALLGLVTIMQGGYAKPAAAVVGAIWLMWAGFILFSIWRRSVALEFSPVDLQEGNSRSIEHR